MGLLGRSRKKQASRPRQGRSGAQIEPQSVYSYHSNRSRSDEAVRHPEKQGRRLYIRWRHLPTILAAIAIVASLAYILTVNSNPHVVVRATSPESAKLLKSPSVYEGAAEKLLASSLLNRSKITIDTAGVSQKMQEQFPELAGVSITLPLMGRWPIMEIVPSEPALGLIGEQGSYVLDAGGKAIMPLSEAGGITSNAGIPKVSDQTGTDASSGKQVLTSSDVAFIREVAAQMSAKGLKVASFTLPAAANELHMKLDGVPYFVKFNMALDARQSAGTFLAAKQNLESKHAMPASYIDVRVEERAYYK